MAVPFTPLLPHLLDLLHARISRPPNDDSDESGRDALANAVLLLPATCHEARALVKLDELRWAWLCAFEQFRMGVPRATFRNHDVHLFDGLPSCIDDIHLQRPGSRPVHAPHQDCTLVESLADGPHFCTMVWTAFAMRVAKDEHLREGLSESANAKGHTSGLVAVDALPHVLPLRVRVFAGFLRWTSQYALDIVSDSAPPRSILVACDRKGCARPAHPEAPESWASGPFASLAPCDKGQAEDAEKLTEYWETAKMCASSEKQATSLSRMRFCSSICAMQAWQEYDRCIRCATFEELAAAPAESRRAPNVSRMYREVLDRNAAVSRRMRANKGVPTLRHWNDAAFSVRIERENWIRILNVDAAMLYAASFFAELGHGRRSKKAVPSKPDWRLAGARWLNALARLGRIMRSKESGPPALAINYFSPPRWFRSVKDAALGGVF